MRVGIIGWRGMVGSVLVRRMREERDFDLVDPVFFSTSQAGAAAPEVGWYKERGKDNIVRILGRRGILPITVRVLPPLDRVGNRKQITHAARDAIARTLRFKLPDHSPIGVGE